MAELPDTRVTLLVRLRNAHDQDAWRQFVSIYAPVVYGYARRQGLQEADAEDVTQEVLRGVAAAAPRLNAVAERGSFRQWLFTLAHHRVFDLRQRQARPGQGSGDSSVQRLLEENAVADSDQSAWDREYQQRLFAWAAEQVRPRCEEATWQAFWLTAVEGAAAAEVARRLNLAVAAVYLAKSRVMARLREQIEAVEET